MTTGKFVEALRSGLEKVRTLEQVSGIKADYYGMPTPLGQMAAVTSPEPRLVLVKPYQADQLRVIDKAIRDAGLGLNPSVDASFVRVIFRSRRRSGAYLATGNTPPPDALTAALSA
ncbi:MULTISPECIES: ribosome-recycling factor [unclassified Streptomyces]|uniref:ribosome recycling factor n=2 Tax=Streptomyces TaxID=1883 RepID=UPI0020246806|nr:ribosome-recycling factor [Streptomyces sp. A 4/2]WSV58362.1 ribosome recycling factor [Streptomyces sp. NBC_01014]